MRGRPVISASAILTTPEVGGAPRNHVEQSGFARPVGSDKARNGPLFYFKRGSIDSAKAPKMLVYIFNFNHCANIQILNGPH